ncbi:hypothetical protein CN090_24685 [Sinorhizobium meliloti]|nr:hypothetical protein C7U62_15800 [Mesorhizobium loti]RVG55116.1 hypothetical protein CN222_35490 [Sinorhizobium meliloti]RVG90520.1 hypothetical protein CN218_23400 [Sinorhizobium meliloti]RVG91398.1 hypothetical protein CN221_22560 [Sinorhizobium meliloti]RVH60288.1 hypothetical protein CN213_05380 [Sinorhizobium meliloti]
MGIWPLIRLPAPSPRKAGRRDKRHALSPDELERAPPVSFAPLAGRRCRQADEGLSRGRSLFQ